jgi:hypothetical protein
MMKIRRHSPIRDFSAALFISTGLFAFFAVSSASGEDLARAGQDLKAKYAADINQLAEECEKKGLTEEAKKTRAVLGPTDPMKFYVPILPVEIGPAKLPENASSDAVEWDRKLNRLRKDQSAALFELARRAMRGKMPGLALVWAMDSIRANPDNENVRRLFGYQKYQNQWRTAYEARKLRQGMVWSDKFGWLPKAHVKRYEDGQRFRNSKWITAEEDAAMHKDIKSGWNIETEHYTICTNRSFEAGVELGQKLEQLYLLWGQLFICYYISENDVNALFDGRARTASATQKHQVVYFRDRENYLDSLKKVFPDIGISVGFYQSRMRTAYFYADEKNDFRTLLHEATHQLFQESRPVSPKAGTTTNYWIIEGIALYMESLQIRDGYYELGGFEDERMQAARYRLLHDGFYVPLAELVEYNAEKLQKDPKIATIYSQSAGLAHFLIHYDNARYRDALVTYLSDVYAARDNAQTLPKLTEKKFEDLDQEYKTFMKNKGQAKEEAKR